MTSKEVADRLGLSHRQIDHWTRLGFAHATWSDGDGTGSRRYYNENDFQRIKVLADLRAAGFTLEAAADLLARAEDLRADLSCVEFLVADGKVRIAERSSK